MSSEAMTPIWKRGWVLRLGILLGLVLVGLGVVMWYNRPIVPVVLTDGERQVIQTKVSVIQQQTPPPKALEPIYEKGSKEIVITERELNGLLNENTELGTKLQFELVTDAIHARLETDLDPDLPLLGGKRLKARARILVTSDAQQLRMVLDDLSVWGVSLPNDWLGGIKGKNILAEIFGIPDGKISGIETLRVEREKIVIRLKD